MAAPVIFISYRRDDSQGHAGRLHDRLAARFGEQRVFLDVDALDAGADFVEIIRERIRRADVLLALIGPRWLSAADAQGRWRLADENDYVRLEIVSALERGLRIVPVLLQGATMPRASDLPAALAPLARRNAFDIRDASFDDDVARLLDNLAPRWTDRVTRRLRRTPVVAAVGVTVVALAGVALYPQVLKLSMTPEQARVQLVQMGLAYDMRSFVKAVERNDERAVRLYLRAGIDPEGQGRERGEAMGWAAENRNVALLEALTDHGASVDAALIASLDDPRTFEWVMDRRPSAQAITGALPAAARRQGATLLEVLVDAGADVNALVGGSTALIQAADRANLAGMQFLLARGANPGLKGSHDTTALHAAADETPTEEDHVARLQAVIRRLVEAGADLEARTTSMTQWQPTPLLLALTSDAPALARTLIELGADVNARTGDIGPQRRELTALMWAVRAGSLDTSRLLLERNADVHARNELGETALFIAAENRQPAQSRLVRLLLDHGAKPDATTRRGSTVLMRAADNASVEPDVIAMLIAAGIDVNAANEAGRTALMAAVVAENTATVRALLAAGAKTEAVDADGKTAATLALEAGAPELRSLLGPAARGGGTGKAL